MKRIEISNGEIRIGYEIGDLVGEARETVMDEARATLDSFEEEEDYEDFDDDWVEDFIKVNNYLYDESGKMLNIHYRVANNVIGTSYKVGEKEYTATINDILGPVLDPIEIRKMEDAILSRFEEYGVDTEHQDFDLILMSEYHEIEPRNLYAWLVNMEDSGIMEDIADGHYHTFDIDEKNYFSDSYNALRHGK